MTERSERVHVGWHCAKVKGHAELKIQKPRVKTLSYDFPNLPHSNPRSFRGLGHSKVTWRHTKVKVWRIEGASKVPLCQIWCNSDQYSRSYCILKKIAAHHFSLIGRHLESVSRTECRSDSGILFLSSYRVNVTSCNLCAREKVPDHRELKNGTESFSGKIALTVTELFNKVCEKV